MNAFTVNDDLSFNSASGKDAIVSSSDLVGFTLDLLAGSIDLLVTSSAWNSDANLLFDIESLLHGAGGNTSSVFELESSLA